MSRRVKIVLMPVDDTLCVCRACKREFTILKENLLESWNQCHHCGSLRYDFKEDAEAREEESKRRKEKREAKKKLQWKE